MLQDAGKPGSFFVNDVEVRYRPPTECVIDGLEYYDVFKLLPFFKKLFNNPFTKQFDPVNILLRGNPGQGKSLLAAFMAQQEGIPYISFPCSADTSDRQLRGGFTVRGDQSTPFVLGVMSNAIQVANEVGACLLVLEEVNNLRPQQQKHLNPLTDFQRRVELPEISLSLSLRKDAKLIVFGTSTEAGFSFKYNQDLKTRFREIDLGYPKLEDEIQLVQTLTRGVLATDQVTKLVNLAWATRNGFTSHCISTREVVATIQDIMRVGWLDALFLLCQKFDVSDRGTILGQIKDMTGLEVPYATSTWTPGA